jgi:thioredoxin 1
VNNKSGIKVVLGLALIFAVIGFVVIGQKNKSSDKKTVSTSSQSATTKKTEAPSEKSYMSTDISKQGNYMTLADYNAKPEKFAETKVIYFFHASWCPTCQAIDKEITSDPSKIPAGVTIIKTDFDTSTDLRKKFGVTQQYTFVQVDKANNKSSLWSASSLDDAIAGIK